MSPGIYYNVECDEVIYITEVNGYNLHAECREGYVAYSGWYDFDTDDWYFIGEF